MSISIERSATGRRLGSWHRKIDKQMKVWILTRLLQKAAGASTWERHRNGHPRGPGLTPGRELLAVKEPHEYE